MYRDHLVTCDNGLLPHPITYSQINPDKYPMSARELRAAGYYEVKYQWEFTKMWFFIPVVKTGTSTLWVRCRSEAESLIGYWSGGAWRYSINWTQHLGIIPY